MTDDLKPCPFCGGKASIRESGGSSEVDGYTTFHVVGCWNCGVSRQSHSKPYTGPKPEEAIPHAILLWNTRDPEIDVQVLNSLSQAILESSTLADLTSLRLTVQAIRQHSQKGEDVNE